MKKDSIERFISLMYSKDSKLNTIDDLNERKMKAAAMADMDPNDSTIQSKVFNFKDERIRIMIVNFLNKENPNAFIKLISDQQLFWNLQSQLMIEIDDKTDTDRLLKISEQSEKLLERIDRMKQKVYQEKEIIQEAETKIRALSPEMRLKEGNTKNIA